MDRQTLRDWVHRYNAAGLAGLRDLKSPGPGSKLTVRRQQAELAELGLQHILHSSVLQIPTRSKGWTDLAPGFIQF